MKKLLLIALLFCSCSEKQRDIISASETKDLQVIGYYQYVESEIIPDESKNSNYPLLLADSCFSEECVNSAIETRNNFFNNISDSSLAVFLSRIGYNSHPINEDSGLTRYYHSIQSLPFVYKATKYNDKDSSILQINGPVDNTRNLNLKLDDKSYCIKAGDTLTIIDTLTARKDSTWCWQRLIITKMIIYFGTIPSIDERLQLFFSSF